MKINEIVIVTNPGNTYSIYVEMARKLKLDVSPFLTYKQNNRETAIKHSLKHKWRYGGSPKRGDKSRIISTYKNFRGDIYLGIERLSDSRQFVIGEEGLKSTHEIYCYLPEDLFEI